jgi:hypothetical protein
VGLLDNGAARRAIDERYSDERIQKMALWLQSITAMDSDLQDGRACCHRVLRTEQRLGLGLGRQDPLALLPCKMCYSLKPLPWGLRRTCEVLSAL